MSINCYIYHARASLYTQSYVQETIQICTELSGNGRNTIILTSGNTLHTSAPDFVYDDKSIKKSTKIHAAQQKRKMAKNKEKIEDEGTSAVSLESVEKKRQMMSAAAMR